MVKRNFILLKKYLEHYDIVSVHIYIGSKINLTFDSFLFVVIILQIINNNNNTFFFVQI